MKYLYLLSICALFAGCSGSKKGLDGKMILSYNESGGIGNLDPLFAERFEDIWAMSQVYNGLLRLDENMEIEGDLAKSWEISRNKMVYTFHLKTNVFFHDHEAFENGKGRRLVAQDVINSYQRIVDPENVSQGKYIFTNIDKLGSSNHLGMEAVNDSTVKLYLKKPQHSFLKLLSLPFCYVVPLEVVDYYGDDFTRNPVGTGPFQFKVWHQGSKLVFVKNENYFEKDESGNQLPYLDAVSISFVRSRHTEFQKFLQGGFDFISGLDDSYQNSLLTEAGVLSADYTEDYYLEKKPWLKVDYIGFYLEEEAEVNANSAITNRAVRRAINYAINKEKLIAHVRRGIGVPAHNGFVPAGLNDYDGRKVDGYEYNPKKVEDLLFEAGFTGANDKPKVHLVCAENYKVLAEFIMNELNEQGFECSIELVLPSILRQKVASGNTNFFRKSWTGDFPDALNFLNLFHSGRFAPENGPNYTHFSDDMFDTWMERAESDISEEEREELYYKMDQTIIDEAPVVPLFYDELIKVVSKKVKGLRTNAMNQLDLRYVTIED